MAELRRSITAALSSRGGLVLLAGEPGIGRRGRSKRSAVPLGAARCACLRAIGTIEVELGTAFGLGGCPRRVSNLAECARKAVYMRIRNTTAHLRTLHPELARHLELTVRTGGICFYEPESPIAWKVS